MVNLMTSLKNKKELINVLRTSDPQACEDYYCECGPGKHDQEDHYTTGIAVVDMNVDLMLSWLENNHDNAYDIWESMSKDEKKKAFKASHFHFGIYGYDDEDVDYYFKKEW